MNTISFKLQEVILNKMDSLLKPLHFNNRTEFIREAIREKLKKTEDDRFLKALKKFHGAAKTKTSYKEERRIREEVGKEIAKKFNIKLD